MFIHGGNVWLIRPDGSGARQVTSDGTTASPYEHPTMSDAGVIAVMKGSTIVRMRQDGAVLNRITPESLFVPDSGTVVINPVQDPEISPDGTKIAYSQLRYEQYGNGGWYEVEAETSFTDAAQWSAPSKYGIVLGFQPGWIGNSKVTLNKNGDVHLADLGHAAAPWFFSDDIYGRFIELNQVEVAPNRERIAFGNAAGVALWATNGDPAGASPGRPTPSGFVCALTADSGKPIAQDPTVGPDSDSLAYSENGDLWVATGLGACGAGTALTRILTGGTEPDWSPAPLSAAPAPGTPGSGGTASGGGTHTFALTKAPTVTGRAKVGKRLHATSGAWSPSPASVSYTWLRNGKVVRGRTGATYAVVRADRGKRIQVRVTVRRSGYAARVATSKAVITKR